MSEKSKNNGSIKSLPGVQLLIDFLLNQRAGEKISTGEQVAILGGGKAAIEAATGCFKEGVKDIAIIIRASREKGPFSEEDIKQAEEQGVKFHFQSVVTKLSGKAENLTHIEIARISESGEEVGDRDIIPSDTLLTGAGRFPELIYVPLIEEGEEDSEEEKNREIVGWETLYPYPGPFARQDTGIFRPGEEAGDYKAVVEAIGSGRRAASSVQRYLTDEAVEAPANMIRRTTNVLSLDELEPISKATRTKMPELSHEESTNNPDKEIARGYSEDQAIQEANRCLQCGLICYRRAEGKLH